MALTTGDIIAVPYWALICFVILDMRQSIIEIKTEKVVTWTVAPSIHGKQSVIWMQFHLQTLKISGARVTLGKAFHGITFFK